MDLAHFWNNTSGAYQINQSLRFNSADSAYLNRTPAGSGTGAGRTWTWSGWIKRGKSTPSDLQLILSASSSRSGFGFFTYSGGGTGSDTFSVYHNASFIQRVETTQVFRDFSSWYHVVVSVDTTQATAANRIRIYVNGAEVTNFSTATYPAQNYQFGICEATAHNVGRDSGGGAYYFDGYLSECHLIDGTALTPSSFGETDTITGAWIPKKYSGSYGTNGFYLKFEGSGIGTDSSGNGNNWTANNFSTSGTGTDVMSDTPTTNYPTFNPLKYRTGYTAATYSNGSLEVVQPSSQVSWATMAFPNTGKWYWEVTYLAAGTVDNDRVRGLLYANGLDGANKLFIVDFRNSRYIIGSGSYVNFSPSLGADAVNDVLSFAWDVDAGEITVGRNNSTRTVTGISVPTEPVVYGSFCDYNVKDGVNFGQRAFAYTPPTGFKALNTANLPEPTIKKGSKYFDTKLFTAGTTTVTGYGFQPDLVWVKNRDQAYDHRLIDAVRGVQKDLSSNTPGTEQNRSDSLLTFTSDGFTHGSFGSGSGDAFVAWAWDANGAGSSNTAGTITSTVSANASAGFSIVTYTGNATAGATVGHGLGVAPKMIIVKNRDVADNWLIQHASLGPTKYLLFTTAAAGTTGLTWNDTAPTSTVFTLGSGDPNQNTRKFVAYCFSEVAGYSKFGSYTGNGSSDGPFVYCGFKPALIIFKNTSVTEAWSIFDSTRNDYNGPDAKMLLPSSNASEATAADRDIDFLSNGFKLRVNALNPNTTSGDVYIFAAFAENPFKYANAR